MGRKKKVVEEKPNENIVAPAYDQVTEGGTPPKKTQKEPEKNETKLNITEIEDIVSDGLPILKKEEYQNDKALKEFGKQLEKQFGKGSIASAEELFNVVKIPTKNLLLDILTEGGLPRGSISLFWGKPSSGKSLQSFLCASVFTSQKIPVLYIACEGDIDLSYISSLGVDLKYLQVVRPSDLESAIDIADVAVRSRQFGLVIFDSLTAGIPKEALDKKTEKDQMALQARRNKKLVGKLTNGLQPMSLTEEESYNKTTVILIAHLSMKVGLVFGSPESLCGGQGIQHHASYIIKFTKGAKLEKTIKEDVQEDTKGKKKKSSGEKEVVGQEMKLNIEKAKFSTPFVSGITEIRFRPTRVNNIKVLLTHSIQKGIIERGGAYYTYKDLRCQGAEAFIKELKQQPKLLKEIKDALIKGI